MRLGVAKENTVYMNSALVCYQTSCRVFIMSQVVKILSRTCPLTNKPILLGRLVCQHAFRRLLGLGPTRYYKLKRSARLGEAPPLDGRSVPREHSFVSQRQSLEKRSKIIDFLQEMWNTVAESMPEATEKLTPAKRGADTAPSADKPNAKLKPLGFRRRGKTLKAAAAAHRGKADVQCRMLPPGTFKDYYLLFKAKHPEIAVSFKLFSSDSWCLGVKLDIFYNDVLDMLHEKLRRLILSRILHVALN